MTMQEIERGDLVYYRNWIAVVQHTRQHGWLEIAGISGISTVEAHEVTVATTLRDVPNLEDMQYCYRKLFGCSPILPPAAPAEETRVRRRQGCAGRVD